MAKNFTDFQQVTGAYTAPTTNDGSITGDTVTDATSSMYLVGYDTDSPDGERQYTIESVLLAADKYHVGLENVDNVSNQHLLNDTTLTGHTTADNMFVHGDLVVEGETTQLNTNSIATSSFDITNYGTDVGLEVKQYGTTHSVSRFYNGDELALDITQHGTVGVGVAGDLNTVLTVGGDVTVAGEITSTGAINGRYLQQDGGKLDNIQPWADVTSNVLGDLFNHMTHLQQNAPEYSTITPVKAYDLIEQGDIYTKIPELSSGTGNGVGDQSVTKLRSIEYHSDRTADHSADITYNDVPDGPWTGFVDTTFVKVTSAQHDRLTSIRGVSKNLFSGDDNSDLNDTHVRDAYHSVYPDYWSTADELEYRGTIIPNLDDVRSNVQQVSAQRDATITKMQTSSGNWDSTHMSVYNTSGDWESTHTSVNSTSGDWNNVYTDVSNTSGSWNATYTTTQLNSGEWQASVNNKLDEFGSHQHLEPGVADLTTVTTQNLTATGDVNMSNDVYVLSAGEWKEGITATIPLGQDTLIFVNGILIEWRQ